MIFMNKMIKNKLKLLKIAVITGILLNSGIAFSQTIAPSADQKLYTKQDLKFDLLIPNVKPENIQIQTQNLPSGVSLRTLRKTEQYGETNGTLIELWYNFEKPGNYNDMPRLTILVQNRRRYFYYEPFKITENPANMLPRIVIEFENGTVIKSDDPIPSKAIFTAPVAQKINFRVNLQYATQLVQFNWDIPKDSIFTQTKTYEITEIKYREKNYTSDLIPVADFEWTALSKGLNAIPKMKLVATAYNGYRNELLLTNFAVNFVDAVSSENSNSEFDSMFDAAFSSSSDTQSENQKTEITYEDCQEILRLRHGEKFNIVKSLEFKKQRIELEESLDLPSEYDEYYAGFFVLSVLLFIVLLAFLIIFIKKRMSLMQIFITVMLIFSITAIIISTVHLSKSYGISTGAELYSIPEENLNSSGEISAGNRVQILEKAGNWYFVEMGSINGWTKSDNILE